MYLTIMRLITICCVSGFTLLAEYGIDEAYVEEDGIIVIESEDIPHNENWKVTLTPKGFTGESYLKYVGPNMGSGNPDAHNIDVKCNFQQKIQDRLVMWCYIKTEGEYTVSVLAYHELDDGDNDAWVGYVDKHCDATRIGSTFKIKGEFQWNNFCGLKNENQKHKWTRMCHPEYLKKGLYGIYIAGRSPNYAIDRIAIVKDRENKWEHDVFKKSFPKSSIKLISK